MEIENESALPALPFPCRSALEARLQCWHLRPFPVFGGFCTWLRSFQRSPHQVAEVGLALGAPWLALPCMSLSLPIQCRRLLADPKDALSAAGATSTHRTD